MNKNHKQCRNIVRDRGETEISKKQTTTAHGGHTPLLALHTMNTNPFTWDTSKALPKQKNVAVALLVQLNGKR